MARPKIQGLLVPIGSVDPAFMDYLALVLPEAVGLRFDVHERALPADGAYDPVRQQWNAAPVLEALRGVALAASARRVLGVADVDLFIPILTFVFGLAHLGERAALISAHRLRSEFYGLPPSPELLLERIEKEAVHELGHTGRLVHCRDFSCVMHYSNAVEEVDLKGARFCERCRKGLDLR